MNRFSAMLAFAFAVPAVIPAWAIAGDLSVPAPLTFDASRNGTAGYSLNWTMRLGEAVPVRTGVRVGIAGSEDGTVAELPLRVTTGIGDMDDATGSIRRSIELTASQTAASGDASVTVRRARPLAIAPGFDAELRQSVTTGLRAGASRAEGMLRTSQTLVMDDVLPKTSLQATTVLSSDQRGVSAQLRIERRLLKDFTVSADVGHNPTTNNARLDARYSLSW